MAIPKTLRAGDTGVPIYWTIRDDETGDPIDVSSASSLKVRLESPQTKTIKGPLDLVGVDLPNGRVKWVTDGSLVEVGTWEAQGYCAIGAQVLRSRLSSFVVERALDL